MWPQAWSDVWTGFARGTPQRYFKEAVVLRAAQEVGRTTPGSSLPAPGQAPPHPRPSQGELACFAERLPDFGRARFAGNFQRTSAGAADKKYFYPAAGLAFSPEKTGRHDARIVDDDEAR